MGALELALVGFVGYVLYSRSRSVGVVPRAPNTAPQPTVAATNPTQQQGGGAIGGYISAGVGAIGAIAGIAQNYSSNSAGGGYSSYDSGANGGGASTDYSSDNGGYDSSGDY